MHILRIYTRRIRRINKENWRISRKENIKSTCNMLMSSGFTFGDRNFSGSKLREGSAQD